MPHSGPDTADAVPEIDAIVSFGALNRPVVDREGNGVALAQRNDLGTALHPAIKIAPAGRSTGEAILDHASSLGCDLLVKGAYTQSRLRQMIFGGAMRHILANATLPVLMAH